MDAFNPLTHYIELRLRPDPEISPTQLLSALYKRVHLALVAHATDRVAVSFPGYDAAQHTLGERLRLHGAESDLQQWAGGEWLAGMRDHVDVSPVLPVPADALHRTLRRMQVKSSPDRLRRRLMKRHQLTEAQARERLPDSMARLTSLPFVSMASGSSGQQFPLFLELGPPRQSPQQGPFNAYGLGTTATVPWF